MKKNLIIKPNPKKNFENFVYNTENSSIDWCKNWQEEYNLLRIQASPGNGSSHLIHAMANRLLSKGRKVILLDFALITQFDSSILKSSNQIFQHEIILIDHFDVPFYSKKRSSLVFNFVHLLSKLNIPIAFTCKPHFDVEGSFFQGAGYSAPSMFITIHPLDANQRVNWLTSMTDRYMLNTIPGTLFYTDDSNKDFLIRITPFLLKNIPLNPKSISFKSELNQRLNIINLAFLKHKVAIAEIEIAKDELLRSQQFEEALELREMQKRLEPAFELIETLIKEIKHILPFSHEYFNQFITITKLSFEFQAMDATLKELSQKTNERINALKLQREELKKDPMAPYNPEILQEIRLWQQTAFKLNKDING